MEVLGIDIGGSGIKGAPVETNTGELLAERVRIPTPEPAKPKPIAQAVAEIASSFDWKGPVGCGFPAAIRNGVVLTAVNIDKKWLGTNAAALFAEATGCPVRVINDADAAGLAEMRWGAGRGRNGVVIMVTVGTGLGTALFTDGHLLPNTELGHIELNCEDAETLASDAVRKDNDLSWKAWGGRLNEYLTRMSALFWPDLIILGGGVSKKFDRFAEYLKVDVEVVPAQMLNEAGIAGAALAGVTLGD